MLSLDPNLIETNRYLDNHRIKNINLSIYSYIYSNSITHRHPGPTHIIISYVFQCKYLQLYGIYYFKRLNILLYEYIYIYIENNNF